MRYLNTLTLLILGMALLGCGEKPEVRATRYLRMTTTVFVPVDMGAWSASVVEALKGGKKADLANSPFKLATIDESGQKTVRMWFYAEHAPKDLDLMETTPQQVLESAIADASVGVISVGEGQSKPVRLSRAEWAPVLEQIGPPKSRIARSMR